MGSKLTKCKGGFFCFRLSFSISRNASAYPLSCVLSHKALKCSDCQIKLNKTELWRTNSRKASLCCKVTRGVSSAPFLVSVLPKGFILKIQKSRKSHGKVTCNRISSPSPLHRSLPPAPRAAAPHSVKNSVLITHRGAFSAHVDALLILSLLGVMFAQAVLWLLRLQRLPNAIQILKHPSACILHFRY